MRLPTGGPFLEFNFYWADLSEEEAFVRLVAALLNLGARFRRSDITSMKDLEQRLTDPQANLHQVYMEGATNTTHGVAKIITYTTISEDVARYDHRPIAIWTEGRWTEAWQHETKVGFQQARTSGRRAKDRFCSLIERTHPSYAAITVEDVLRTPYELSRKPYGHAFHDFYISATYIGREAVDEITRLYAGAYIEPITEGVYISCWEFLNPRGKGLTSGLEAKKSAVARYIAATR